MLKSDQEQSSESLWSFSSHVVFLGVSYVKKLPLSLLSKPHLVLFKNELMNASP